MNDPYEQQTMRTWLVNFIILGAPDGGVTANHVVCGRNIYFSDTVNAYGLMIECGEHWNTCPAVIKGDC